MRRVSTPWTFLICWSLSSLTWKWVNFCMSLRVAAGSLRPRWSVCMCEQGVNWFGFETGEAMVNGLYANYANPRNFSQVGDFATVVHRQQALGFNAIRLPFRCRSSTTRKSTRKQHGSLKLAENVISGQSYSAPISNLHRMSKAYFFADLRSSICQPRTTREPAPWTQSSSFL